jgi:hypothetical protein
MTDAEAPKPEDRQIRLVDAFNPYHPDGIKYLRGNLGSGQGFLLAEAHYPSDVIWDEKSIEQYGRKVFRRCYKELGVEKLELDYDMDEMARLFAVGFVDGYEHRIFASESIDHPRIMDEELKTILAQRGHRRLLPRNDYETGVRIISSTQGNGNRIYQIELKDPGHLSGPVRFEVELANDGQTELREADPNA